MKGIFLARKRQEPRSYLRLILFLDVNCLSATTSSTQHYELLQCQWSSKSTTPSAVTPKFLMLCQDRRLSFGDLSFFFRIIGKPDFGGNRGKRYSKNVAPLKLAALPTAYLLGLLLLSGEPGISWGLFTNGFCKGTAVLKDSSELSSSLSSYSILAKKAGGSDKDLFSGTVSGICGSFDSLAKHWSGVPGFSSHLKGTEATYFTGRGAGDNGLRIGFQSFFGAPGLSSQINGIVICCLICLLVAFTWLSLSSIVTVELVRVWF
ncbi:hypothetical protein Cgig2_033199 [Carnegiea gigantea]|uniref:Uncharacterized protein n=1 Tax=Carnegiea gigantea TaxID=171969 RepID=A0A9Q1JQV3_9CARY|nr:hypothetical protein Cgig2_033199 [Carnegiea gigantea]